MYYLLIRIIKKKFKLLETEDELKIKKRSILPYLIILIINITKLAEIYNNY